MRNFITLLMLVLSVGAQAQQGRFMAGHLQLRDGSSQTGYVLGQFSLDEPKGVYFKKEPAAAAAYIEFNQIQTLTIDAAQRYITHCTQATAQSRCYWLQTLLEGTVSLYQSTADPDLYFIEEAGVFNAIREPSFPGILALLKQKCAGFSPPKNQKFYTPTLIEAISLYNQCKNPQNPPKVYWQPAPAAAFYLGVKLGVNLGSASIFENNYYGKGDYQADPAFTGGLAAQLFITPHWAVTAELNYFQRRFQDDSVNVWPILSPNYSSVALDLSFLEIPLGVQYHLSKGAVSPFVQAGIHVGLPLNRTLQEEMFNASPDELKDQPKITFPGLGYGYGGGAGLNVQLNEQLRIQGLVQYTRFSTALRAQSRLFDSGGTEQETPIHQSRLQIGLSVLRRF